MNKTSYRFLFAGIILSLLAPVVAPRVASAGDAPAWHAPDRTAPPRFRHNSVDGLNVYQRQLVRRHLSGATAVVDDTLRVIALQVQFADSLMGGQPGSLREGQPRDSLWFANELTHLEDYFRGASRGHLVVDWTLDGTLYTMPKDMGYYGRDTFEEERVVELVQTLVDSADANVDFSAYDHVFVIHAGAGQETDIVGDSRSQLWSSFYDANDIDAAYPDSAVAGLSTDDMLSGEPFFVDNFSLVPEDASQDFTTIGTLGIWAFEVGNRVGLLPLFDSTPGGFPDSQGVGQFDLMGFGLFVVNGFVPTYPCVFNRVLAGWVDPVVVEPGTSPRQLRLADINTGGAADTVAVKIPITESEYYLVVNRVHDANFDSLFTFTDNDSDLIPDNTDGLDGAEFDFFMTDLSNPFEVRFDPRYGFDVLFRKTGSGMYVWHIDESVVRGTLSNGFLPTDFVDRKGVDLEEADGVQDLDALGPSAFALGSYFDSWRAGDGNQTVFGPDTEPRSTSNGGVPSGIVLEDFSAPGLFMTVTLRRQADFDETRARWSASTFAQPATPVDWDGVGETEILVLADSGRVYAFDHTGAEYSDLDADPTTIEPYIVADGVEWVGPPAFADVDAGGDVELFAAGTDALYAFKSDGSELTDGDGDGGTIGVLYAAPMAAAPMLLDMVGPDPAPEVTVVERAGAGDSLRVRFVNAAGLPFSPTDPAFDPLWPFAVQGQFVAPLGLAGTANGVTPAKLGVVLAWADSLSGTAGVAYVPARYQSDASFTGQPVASTWRSTISIPAGVPARAFVPSAPACGDIDADGDDEVVVTLRNGRLLIYENGETVAGSVTPRIVDLRASNPSAPALADMDLDGGLEILVWDDEYLYVLEPNGAPTTDWPRRIVPANAGEQPPLFVRRGLESPLAADLDGDGTIDALFPALDGSLLAFRGSGAATAGFPRVGPAGAGATPAVAQLATGGPVSIVTAGAIASLERVETVIDSFVTREGATLAIQSLPGAGAADRRYWSMYRNGLERHGRITEFVEPVSGGAPVESSTFMIYPNPVRDTVVRVRVTLNRAATLTIEVYNVEGEEATTARFNANPGGLAGVPFDEAIDISRLKSGVYFVRLEVSTDAGSETLIKPFAIRR